MFMREDMQNGVRWLLYLMVYAIYILMWHSTTFQSLDMPILIHGVKDENWFKHSSLANKYLFHMTSNNIKIYSIY
jgi:hypothetical protein